MFVCPFGDKALPRADSIRRHVQRAHDTTLDASSMRNDPIAPQWRAANEEDDGTDDEDHGAGDEGDENDTDYDDEDEDDDSNSADLDETNFDGTRVNTGPTHARGA